MKALANIWVAIIMVMGLTFVACSPDDDEYGAGFSYVEKPDTTPRDTTNNKPTPDPKDSISIDWSADMEKTFGYSNGQWPSTITIHYTDEKDTTFRANLPMTTRIEAPAEILVASDAPETRFSSLGDVVVDSTAWAKNESDGFFYRTITRTQVIVMNNYEAKIISTHMECYMIKEGKVVYFKHGQEATPTRWNDQPKAAGEDVQKGDKTYTVENAFICMQHKLHASKTEYPEATTRVLREKVEEEKTEEPVVTPTMLTPELKVRTIKNIPDYTFSPEFSGNQLIGWHKVLPVLATAEDGKDYYFIWVDGKYVAKVAVGKENRVFNSAYFAEGSWRPATLEKDTDGGWKYVFVVNNEGKLKTVAENLALTSGLQNFRKSDNASQTPSVYTEKNYTEYSGRKYVEVIGFNIDMKPLIKTTIGECL